MSALLRAHWPLLLGWVVVVSLAAFCLMGVDKRRARRKAWRVQAVLLAVLFSRWP